MFFLAARNWCGHPGSRMAFKTQKHQLFLSKTTCFDEKIKKTQCFFIVLGPVITRQLAFIFWPEWHGHFFLKFAGPQFQTQIWKNWNFSKSASGDQNPSGNTAAGNTPCHQRGLIQIHVVFELGQFETYPYVCILFDITFNMCLPN